MAILTGIILFSSCENNLSDKELFEMLQMTCTDYFQKSQNNQPIWILDETKNYNGDFRITLNQELFNSPQYFIAGEEQIIESIEKETLIYEIKIDDRKKDSIAIYIEHYFLKKEEGPAGIVSKRQDQCKGGLPNLPNGLFVYDKDLGSWAFTSYEEQLSDYFN